MAQCRVVIRGLGTLSRLFTGVGDGERHQTRVTTAPGILREAPSESGHKREHNSLIALIYRDFLDQYSS
jgi:hypothetical protein